MAARCAMQTEAGSRQRQLPGCLPSAACPPCPPWLAGLPFEMQIMLVFVLALIGSIYYSVMKK